MVQQLSPLQINHCFPLLKMSKIQEWEGLVSGTKLGYPGAESQQKSTSQALILPLKLINPSCASSPPLLYAVLFSCPLLSEISKSSVFMPPKESLELTLPRCAQCYNMTQTPIKHSHPKISVPLLKLLPGYDRVVGKLNDAFLFFFFFF